MADLHEHRDLISNFTLFALYKESLQRMSNYIAVPKSPEAQQRLDFNQNKGGDLLEVILSDEDLKVLWKSGVFESINAICGSMIDMYEDESITNEYQLRAVIGSGLLSANYRYFGHIADLKYLFESALLFKTGIFFFF